MAIVLGLTTALAYGTADFLARFSTLKLGVLRALCGTLLAGSLALSLWLALADTPWALLLSEWHWLVLPGLLSFGMLCLLYAALARGPISVASPVVAIHPALVVLCLLALGTRPSARELLGSAIVLGGGVMLATQAEQVGAGLSLSAAYVRKTALLAAACAVVLSAQILAVQHAAERLGALAAAWGSRVFALGCALVALAALRPSQASLDRAGWRISWAQGLLDVTAVTALAYGSGHGSTRAVVPVVGSAFSAVTVVMARFLLKEAMTRLQWVAIGVVLGGILVLGWP
ncbi:MAG: EamA family transporter [Polyangiaceae bacterium]